MGSSQYARPLAGAALTLSLVIVGCGSSLNGTYHQAGGAGIITLEFNSGKVTSTVGGESKQGTYDIKGDKVILHLPGDGDVPLKLNGDGTLDSPLGTFKKG